jgi:hypothetical protein
MSQKISEKVRRKKIREKYFEKIPESRGKLPGFSNPKNFVRFFQSNLPLALEY